MKAENQMDRPNRKGIEMRGGGIEKKYKKTGSGE